MKEPGQTTVKKEKFVPARVRVRWIVLAVLLGWVVAVRFFPSAAEWYARTIYPPVSAFLSALSGLFPFSVGDVFIYGSIGGSIAYIVWRAVTRRSWRVTFRRVAEYLAWVYVWFYLAWGILYFRTDFFTRAELMPVPYSAEKFDSFLSAYTDSLNAAFIPFDSIDKNVTAEEVKKGYRAMAPLFGLMSPGDRLEPKTMLFSSLMSGVGVMGYMGPFSNEFNLNADLLPVQYPAVYAHEMAHLLGVSGEAEANLYSFLVCSGSEVPEIRFAGYFSLFPYVLSNAYAVLDEKAFRDWTERIRPEIRTLYNRKTAYWRERYNPWIGRVQDKLYDWFLKGNRIASGTANYSEVIGLWMAWREKEASRKGDGLQNLR